MHGVGETKTISVNAQWVTSAKVADELIYGVTKALWNDNTRKLLDSGHAKGKSSPRTTRWRASACRCIPARRSSIRKPA